ncbi:MAG: cbb3-type cytochrome oxidase assembly protein CcoS [Alphaproteobacteria bacterium]|nr:cbb3-type cytochrome oxidase assembly protein CcoS [Alphaproteobacteria bacterium]
MTPALVWLVAVAVGMGLVGLFAFLWSLNSGQLEDLDGAAERILSGPGCAAPRSGTSLRVNTLEA